MKKNKLFSVILLSLIVVAFSALLSKGSPVIVNAEDTDYVYISPTNDNKETIGGKEVARCEKDKVYALISVVTSKKVELKVTYHTENLSAISTIDYTETKTSVKINTASSTKSAKISVGCKQSTWGVYSSGYSGIQVTSSSKPLTRSFLIVIDSATYTDSDGEHEFKIQQNKKQLECFLDAKSKVAVESNGKFYQYNHEQSYNYTWKKVDNPETVQTGAQLTNDTYGYEVLRKGGLAEVYVSGSLYMSDCQNSEEEGARFIIGNKRWAEGRSCSYSDGRPSGAFVGCEVGMSIGWFSGSSEMYSTIRAIEKTGSAPSKEKLLSAWAFGKTSDGDIYFDTGNWVYFKNTESLGCGSSLYRYSNNEGKTDVTLYLYQREFDLKVPVVNDIYLQECNDGIYRVSIRFSEPINIGSNTLKLNCETDSTPRVNITFEYAGGNGTDTLYFEVNTKSDYYNELLSNKYITKFSFNTSVTTNPTDTSASYYNFRTIKDFALNNLDSVKSSNARTFKVNIDRRVPVIDSEEANKRSLIPQKSPDVLLSISKLSKGTLYYMWVPKNVAGTGIGNPPGNSFIDFGGGANQEILPFRAVDPSKTSDYYNEWENIGRANSYIDNLKSFASRRTLTRPGFNNIIAGSVSIVNGTTGDTYKQKISFNDLSQTGEYYLVTYIEPEFVVGNPSDIKIYVYGTYIVDNTIPEYGTLHYEDGGMFDEYKLNTTNENKVAGNGEPGISQKIDFVVTDNCNQIDSVYVQIKEADKAGAVVHERLLSGKEIDPNLDGITDANYDKNLKKYKYEYTLRLTDLVDQFYRVDKEHVSVSEESGTYAIRFKVIDIAKNETYIYPEFKNFYISSLSYFELKVDTTDATEENDAGITIYKNGSVTFKISGKEPDIVKGVPFNVSVNGKTLSDFTTFKNADNETKKEFMVENDIYKFTSVNEEGNSEKEYISTLTIKKPGFYKVKYERGYQYSDEYTFYVTDNFNENTTNYLKSSSNELVLSNMVYQLDEDVQFTYVNVEGNIQKENYGGASSPAFSSYSAALDFLMFYEQKDLKYLLLDQNVASYLNNNSGAEYAKAPGEDRTAKAGQVWVRYKIPSWDLTSSSINYWGYYYYSDTPTLDSSIDVNNLSDNLKDSIRIISEKLASNEGIKPHAKTVYLVGEEHLESSTNAPYLTEAQKALSRSMILETTASGDTLKNAYYSGDANLFSSSVKQTEGLLPIASNLKLSVSQETIIMYKKGSDSYHVLKISDGKTIRNAIRDAGAEASSGVYYIRELDNNGGRDYVVYIDNTSPQITYTLGDNATVETHQDNVSNVYSNKIVLNKLYDEIDKQAYVAVFDYSTKNLLYMFYMNNLDGLQGYELSNGVYQIVTGDRSGNMYQFVAFLSDEKPAITVKKSETRVTISIDNRIPDELREFSVYCNDVLLDDTLDIKKTFKQNGNYRIVVRDVYKPDTEYTQEVTFERDEPKIEFYCNDNDSYYKYDKNKEGYMIMEPSDGYNLITTARMLRIVIDPETSEFSVTGATKSDYTYNEMNGQINFNKLCEFYIDIWDKEYPEDVFSYRVVVDSYAPTIDVTTTNKVIYFDETLSSNYELRSNLPKTIKYRVSNETEEKVIDFDDAISNPFVSVVIKDGTRLRDVKVYIDNKLVKECSQDDIDSDGMITFDIANKLGEVRIEATDIFKTSTSFIFSFSENKLSETRIDNEVIVESLVNKHFGNESISYHAINNTESIFKITYSGKTEYLILQPRNGSLYKGEFKITETRVPDSEFTVDTYGVIDYSNGGIEDNDIPVTLNSLGQYKPFDDLDLVVTLNENGSIDVVINASIYTISVEIRANKEDYIAEYYSCTISKEAPTVVFYDEAEGHVPIRETKDGFVFGRTSNITMDFSGTIEVEGESFDKVAIEDIQVAYNDIDFVYEDFEPYRYNIFSYGQGYYTFKFKNIFGNEVIYQYSYSNNIQANVEISYKSQYRQNEKYSIYDNNSRFYSNNSVVVSGYNLSNLYAIRDEDKYITYAEISGDKLGLSITKSSEVYLEDINGNNCTIIIIIGTDPNFAYEDDWITGWPEKANKEEGYTKDVLSIDLNENRLAEEVIQLIRIKSVDSNYERTIYGFDGDNKIEYNSDNFLNCIGLDENLVKYTGVQDYIVIFSNVYGDIATKEIHFSSTPSLVITRQTTSALGVETISVEDCLKEDSNGIKGVWSNAAIMIDSTLDSNHYKFYRVLENEVTELGLKYTFALSGTSQNGTINYKIRYTDAYGYDYTGDNEIEIHLNRVNLVIDQSKMKFVTLNEKVYTRNTIEFGFSDEYSATYTYNGESGIPYTPNKKVFLDGEYTFDIKDKSGNETVISFIKDSQCDFQISAGERIAYNGGVVNANFLTFSQTKGDSSYVRYAKLDGVSIETKEDMSFDRTGHYELIIADEVGNTTFYEFYLICNAIKEFIYNAPKGYIISAVFKNNIPSMACVSKDEAGDDTILQLLEVGKYDVVMKDIYEDSTINFSIEINKDEPIVTLVGCKDGETTTKDISLKDLLSSDIVTVYRNNELYREYVTEGDAFETITEGGNYKIVVKNVQGVAKEFNFIKKNIAAAPLSILIIIVCLLSAGGFFIGLLFRNRSKFDE